VGKRAKRKYDNHGRDQIPIETVNGDVIFESNEIVAPPSEEKQLLDTVRKWVESRLDQQLHHAVKLKLQKELQPKQVRPWSMEVKVAIEKPNQLLSPDITIKQVFDRCKGYLLILGEPGAGKSTSLLDLALELVIRAEADSNQRIPVVIDLSDWQPTVPSFWNKIPTRLSFNSRKNSSTETSSAWSISDFVTYKVSKTYNCPSKQIEELINQRRLIPLLDGLDEVRPEHQQDCVQAIQQWLSSPDLCPRELALCCRREQYEAYSEKLELEIGGAVYLKDLTDEQIQLFLNDANRVELWESLASDENLLTLIRRPLLLSMAVLAYGEIDRTLWQQANSAGDRINLLLDAYVRRMLTKEKERYHKRKILSVGQSQKWLEILALQLLQDSETDFIIEKMQPSWLSTSQQWAYIMILGLVIIVPSISLGVFYRSSYLSIGVILYGLSLLWSEYDSLNDRNSIEVPGLMKISLSRLLKIDLWHKLRIVLIWPSSLFALLPLFSLLTTERENWRSVLLEYSLLPLILLSSLLFSFLFQSSKTEFENPPSPNQGIYNSTHNVIFTAVLFLICLTPATICAYIFFTPQNLLTYILIVGLFVGIVMGGGIFLFKHFTLRLILYFNNIIPSDYTYFLNYMTERKLLQRVGGSYRFVHDLLREFFARSRISKYPNLVSPKAFFYYDDSYYFNEKYKEAVKNLEISLTTKLDAQRSLAISNRGLIPSILGRYEEALKIYDRALELNPKNDRAIADRGRIYKSRKQYIEALEDFNLAIKLNPQDALVIAGRGEIYKSLKRNKEALEDFTSAIELNPKYDSIHILISIRGAMYKSLERYDDALQDFDRAIELNPEYIWAIRCRGEVYLMLSRYDLALKDLNEAIELDSTYDFRFYHRALVYFSLHKPDLGKVDLNSAIEIATKKHTENSADCDNTFNLALYYLVADEIPTAQNFYQIALQHNPSAHDIRDAIRDLEDLLKVLNDVPSAQQTIGKLKQHLK
jgi:tetratricopeptide (TPR) repeat protein